MNEVKRYYLQDEKQDGEPSWYVSVDDHLSAIEQARIDAVREFVKEATKRKIILADKSLVLVDVLKELSK